MSLNQDTESRMSFFYITIRKKNHERIFVIEWGREKRIEELWVVDNAYSDMEFFHAVLWWTIKFDIPH